MRSQHFVPLVLAIGLAFGSGAVLAQKGTHHVRTGDVWVDTRLGEIDDYGRRNRDPFLDEISGHYRAPRPLLVQLLDQRDWAPADVYYACAIAHALNVPCDDIVRDYERDPGQGWGAIAQRRGIKPGSPAFHALKRGTAASYDRWGHPVAIDSDVRVDWSQHGPGKSESKVKSKSKSKSGTGSAKPAHTGHGTDKVRRGSDKGNSGKGKGGKPEAR